jgi:hypothetical protein
MITIFQVQYKHVCCLHCLYSTWNMVIIHVCCLHCLY